MPFAARVFDKYVCPCGPTATAAIGSVTQSTVKIEGQLAARLGDICICPVTKLDQIAVGEPTVFIEGQPAARIGDATVHGGSVISGASTVNIGRGKGAGAAAAQVNCLIVASKTGALGVKA